MTEKPPPQKGKQKQLFARELYPRDDHITQPFNKGVGTLHGIQLLLLML